MSLLLDALKQAADKKQQPDKAGKKKATTETDNAQKPENTDAVSTDKITLELEEIHEELTGEELSESTDDKHDIINEDVKQQDENSFEMDHFDPDEVSLEQIEESDPTPQNQPESDTEHELTQDVTIETTELETETLTSEQKQLASEPGTTTTQEFSEPKQQNNNITADTKKDIAIESKPVDSNETESIKTEKQDKITPDDNSQDQTPKKSPGNKARTMAPENAKIIAGPDKKRNRKSKYLVIGLLSLGILIAGGFLGYLYYLDQDSQISTNIATLSRPPSTRIKPIDDLSAASNQISDEMQNNAANIASDQQVKGSIANIENDEISTDNAVQNDLQQSQEANSNKTTEDTLSNIRYQEKSNLKINESTQNKEAEIAAEELPPTLNSVLNSHPFVQATPMKKGSVTIEPAIKIKRNSNNTAAAKNIAKGYTLFNKGKYQLAKTEYQKAINLAPDSVDALLGLGAIAIIEEDKQKAKTYYSKVLDLNPQNTTAVNAITTIDRSQQSSETLIKQSITQSPNNPWAYFNLGNYYLERQDWSKALQAFNQANILAPNTPDIVYNIAISLDNLDKIEPALNSYKQATILAATKTASFDINIVSDYINQLESQLRKAAANSK